MKNIIVPINFEGYSENAAMFAAHFAKSCNATLTLFHCYHIPGVLPETGSNTLEYMIADADTYTTQQLKKIKAKLVAAEPELLCDYIYESTLRFADETIIEASLQLHADLIIMGTHQEQSIFRIFGGSIFSLLLDKTKVPVLVIPPYVTNSTKFKNIAFAIDYSDPVNLAHVAEGLQFAKLVGAKLICVNVAESEQADDANSRKVQAKYESEMANGTMIFENIIADDLIVGLEDYVNVKNLDLTIMVTHPRSIFQKVTRPSLSKRNVLQTTKPLLVLPG